MVDDGNIVTTQLDVELDVCSTHVGGWCNDATVNQPGEPKAQGS